jgi:hypothetical protein
MGHGSVFFDKRDFLGSLLDVGFQDCKSRTDANRFLIKVCMLYNFRWWFAGM